MENVFILICQIIILISSCRQATNLYLISHYVNCSLFLFLAFIIIANIIFRKISYGN